MSYKNTDGVGSAALWRPEQPALPPHTHAPGTAASTLPSVSTAHAALPCVGPRTAGFPIHAYVYVCVRSPSPGAAGFAGTSSIQTMLSTVIFSIGPAIFDIAAASVYIAVSLQPWIAAIVFVTLRCAAAAAAAAACALRASCCVYAAPIHH